MNPGTGQVVRTGGEVLSALAICLWLWLKQHVELIPTVQMGDGQVQVTSPQGSVAEILCSALNIVIVLTVLGIAVAILSAHQPGIKEAPPVS